MNCLKRGWYFAKARCLEKMTYSMLFIITANQSPRSVTTRWYVILLTLKSFSLILMTSIRCSRAKGGYSTSSMSNSWKNALISKSLTTISTKSSPIRVKIIRKAKKVAVLIKTWTKMIFYRWSKTFVSLAFKTKWMISFWIKMRWILGIQ